MRTKQRWERSGCAKMRSPGRPPAGRREHRVRFWGAVARGRSSEEAAAEAGVSAPVAFRWFREGGGMPSISNAPLSGRYLSFDEREEPRLEGHNCSGRGSAVRFGRLRQRGVSKAFVIGGIDAGKMKPIVTKVLPLSEAIAAQRQAATHHTRGKVVLKIAEDPDLGKGQSAVPESR